MAAMADWTDGPEYAPAERPDAFVASGAPALEAAEAPAPPEDAPAPRPDFTGPSGAAALDQLVASLPDARDPHEAFAVATTPLTMAAGGASAQLATLPIVLSTDAATVHYEAEPGTTTGQLPQAQWAPQQPLNLPDLPPVNLPPSLYGQAPPQVNPQAFPSSDADRWHAAYDPRPQQVPSGPVTLQAIARATDPAVLAALAGGGLLPFVGMPGVAGPLLVTAFVLASSRTRYRRRAVRNAFWVTLGLVATLATFGLADSYGPTLPAWWDSFSGWSQLACWVLLPVLMMMVGGALRRGERPAA